MFTGRQSKILEILLNNVQGVTGAKLAEYMGVSSRTIRNEIGEINQSWGNDDVICSSRKKGYYIDGQQIEAVREHLSLEHKEENASNAGDRGWIILGMTLESGRVNLFDLEDVLHLSQPAIYKEIVKFQKYLMTEYQSEILQVNGDWLRISADEKKLRKTIFRLIKSETERGTRTHFFFLKTLLCNSFDQNEYEFLIKLVKEYFDNSKIQISDANLYMIVSALYITIIRNYQNHRMISLAEPESVSLEIQQFFDYLKEQELLLCNEDFQVLGSLLHNFKLSANPVDESIVDSVSISILEEFCREVMEKYHFDLWQSKEYYNNLLIHIEYMLRRMETGYAVKNPILNDVKKQYPYAYEVSMLIVPIIYRYKSCFIQDDEVSYISIFVEHFLDNINQKLKAVIISSARFSVSTIINNWIQMNYQNQIEVVKVLPQHNLDQYLEDHKVDLIISTMDMVVHSQIHTFRINGIPDHYTQQAMNALVHKIRLDYRFREIIKDHFNPKTIRIFRHQVEFEEIIQEMTEALDKEGCIYDVAEYVNDVLQREVNYPTFLGNSFMIPHPLVTFAKKKAIAAAVLKKPMRMQEKEIQVIFLLAMERKQNDQIGVLFQFFKQMAMDRLSIRKLAAVETEEEFVEVLIQISNSTEAY
ncbi:MAG: PTS sugar transporter subunit IIA [Eubacteriales bacterium]|nr:PTS sugar transporter subunit IIA [Eubacteriales bacterium]